MYISTFEKPIENIWKERKARSKNNPNWEGEGTNFQPTIVSGFFYRKPETAGNSAKVLRQAGFKSKCLKMQLRTVATQGSNGHTVTKPDLQNTEGLFNIKCQSFQV